MSETEKCKVIIYTSLCRIKGDMMIMQGGRVLDSLNAHAKPFIALTDVEILDLESDKIIDTTDFIAVSKDSIIAAYPIV
ncbi:MAG: hypothetical protein C4562_04900 [Actinobacteria bacterium]|nr:MAG: hypothetical protein C4562_04900 [Actinomycetota bacterium]